MPVATLRSDRSESVIQLDISFGLTTLPVIKLLKLLVTVIGSPVLTVTVAEFSLDLVTEISLLIPDTDIVLLRG